MSNNETKEYKIEEYKSTNIHIHTPSILPKETIFEKARIKGTMETLQQNGMPINKNKPPFIIKRTMPSGKVVHIKQEDLL